MSLTRKLFAVHVAALLVAVGCGGSTDNSTGGPGTDGGGDDGGTSGNDATAGNDGSTSNDGSTATDSGGGGGQIACGNTSCDSKTQDCCISQQGATCGAKGSCPGSSLACTSPSSCQGGQVCCGRFTRSDGGTQQFNATCTATCQGQGSFELCSTNADCPNNETCVNGLGGVKVCRRSFDGGGPTDAGGGG